MFAQTIFMLFYLMLICMQDITLLVGSMAVITMIYIRYSIPTYISLFGRFGVKIAAISYLASMASKTVTIILVLLLIRSK